MTSEIHGSEGPFSPSLSFGEALKAAREKAGYSLERAAVSTRISVTFIEALENESFDVLPGEIFGRGFVRNLCRAYGCDAKALVALYDQAIGAEGVESYAETPKDIKTPKPVAVRKAERKPQVDPAQVKKAAASSWKVARPVLIAIPVLLGVLWISQSVYQSIKSSHPNEEKLADTAAAPAQPEPATPTAPAPTPAPGAAASAAPEAAKTAAAEAIVRGTGVEHLDIIVKSPVSLRVGRDKDKQTVEVYQPATYRFQFDEQLRLLVDDMSAVEIRFKDQVIPSKGVKGEKRYMTFAVSEATLAKKSDKTKL